MGNQVHTDGVAIAASHPDHCLDCCRRISPGEGYYQSADVETETMASQLAIDCGGGLMRILSDNQADASGPAR